MTFNLDQFGNGPDDDQYPADAFALVEIEHHKTGKLYTVLAVYLDRKAASDRLKELAREHGQHHVSFTIWETELVR